MIIEDMVVITESRLRGYEFMQYVALVALITTALVLVSIVVFLLNVVSWTVVMSLMFSIYPWARLGRLSAHYSILRAKKMPQPEHGPGAYR